MDPASLSSTNNNKLDEKPSLIVTEDKDFDEPAPGWMSPGDAFIFQDLMKQKPRPDVVLYCYPHSINCLKVMMCLYEKRIPFTRILVNINLGQQFHPDFLALNPRAEVPVLKFRESGEIYCGSDTIIRRIDKVYNLRRHPKHKPLYISENERSLEGLRLMHDWFLEKLRTARIETLLNGSVMFDEDSLGIKPNYPFNYPPARQQIRDMVRDRVSVLRGEANRIKDTNEDAAKFLEEKAIAFQKELPFITEREKYEEVIAEIELLLDDVESQLVRTGLGWWFLGYHFTHADISLAMFLYRIWQIGFANRFWNTTKRRYLYHYFQKLKLEAPCFQEVAQVDEIRGESWPLIAGASICFAVFAYEFLFRRK